MILIRLNMEASEQRIPEKINIYKYIGWILNWLRATKAERKMMETTVKKRQNGCRGGQRIKKGGKILEWSAETNHWETWPHQVFNILQERSAHSSQMAIRLLRLTHPFTYEGGGGWINKIKHVQHCLHRNRWQEWFQQIPEVRCSAVTMAVVAAHIASSLCCHGHLCSGNNSSYPSNPASPTHPSPCLSISLRHWEP